MPGDHVRLASPTSTPSPEGVEGVEASQAVLESWDVIMEVAAHAPDRHGYLAGADWACR